VLITEASSEIGMATAYIFAEAGWQVAATMRHPENWDEIELHENIKLYKAEPSKDSKELSRLILKELGKVDIIINNEGQNLARLFKFPEPDEDNRCLMMISNQIDLNSLEGESDILLNVTSLKHHSASADMTLYKGESAPTPEIKGSNYLSDMISNKLKDFFSTGSQSLQFAKMAMNIFTTATRAKAV